MKHVENDIIFPILIDIFSQPSYNFQYHRYHGTRAFTLNNHFTSMEGQTTYLEVLVSVLMLMSMDVSEVSKLTTDCKTLIF